MIAIITKRVISIDSTKSNAGGGRGLFLQDPSTGLDVVTVSQR